MFGRGGPFGSMFGDSDPFYADPFSQMDQMMNSMFSDPFFSNPLLRPPMVQQPQQPRGRQPVIEELDDGEHHGRAVTAQDEPIVEEPDEEGSPHGRAAQRQRRHSPTRAAAPPTQMDPFGSLFGALTAGAGAGGGSGFMFSSSSYSSMGPGGVSYQSSSTTRVGPSGVRESQSVVRDGRSGTEAVTISRGLGDGRQRTLVRTRDATGREDQHEDLKGISEYEVDIFDDQWRQQAERNLPGGGAFGAVAGRIGGGSGGRGGGQRPLALPSSGSAPQPPLPQPRPVAAYDSGARGAGAATTSLRSSYTGHGSAGLSRQPSAGVSHYAPSTSGRSTASGATAATAGHGYGYGGTGAQSGAISHGAYSHGAPASSHVGGGRAACAGAGAGGGGSAGYSSASHREHYTPRPPPQSAGGSVAGRSTYGSGAYAPTGGQQRHRY